MDYRQSAYSSAVRFCTSCKSLKLWVILFFSIQYNTECYAEFRDPTKPAFYSANTATDYSQTGDLNLSSIWISSHSKRATINGVTAKQGDYIFSDIKIVQILNDSVLIKQNGISRKLYLLTRSYKTQQKSKAPQ